MKTIIEIAYESGMNKILDEHAAEYGNGMFEDTQYPELEKFAELVRADERDRAMRENAYVLAERDRNTQLLYKMHERAFGMHNYYKHAAVEINRKDGEGEKI